eukprot:GDKH01008360.1.p2 GENE.GDKH01008360.1~~GDKH01008360.1.p2  ORF type:complete len:105 (+),score=25.24 GDKH01008360.1:1-315(+)
MAPKVQKSKEQKAAAAQAGGKSRKKKWSKNKNREKAQHHVFYTEALLKGLEESIPKAKMITQYTVTDKLKVNASLARQGLKYLASKNLVKPVNSGHGVVVYTKA